MALKISGGEEGQEEELAFCSEVDKGKVVVAEEEEEEATEAASEESEEEEAIPSQSWQNCMYTSL